jgi:hypothetical protein
VAYSGCSVQRTYILLVGWRVLSEQRHSVLIETALTVEAVWLVSLWLERAYRGWRKAEMPNKRASQPRKIGTARMVSRSRCAAAIVGQKMACDGLVWCWRPRQHLTTRAPMTPHDRTTVASSFTNCESCCRSGTRRTCADYCSATIGVPLANHTRAMVRTRSPH